MDQELGKFTPANISRVWDYDAHIHKLSNENHDTFDLIYKTQHAYIKNKQVTNGPEQILI